MVEKDAVPSDGITGVYPVVPPPYPNPPPIPELPPIVPPPIIGTDNLPGKGNLLYVSTHKGLAKCTGAYGTDGTDGVPVWASMNGSGGGALGNVVIRWFNLDPFSVSGDHFTSGWAMTDGGLYRVTGLPDAPVWSLQLSPADMASLLGIALGSLNYSIYFTPSVRKAGFLWVAAGINSSYSGISYMKVYALVSYDYGATWSCDTSKWVNLRNTRWNGVRVQASYHLDDTYYLSYIEPAWIFGNETEPHTDIFSDRAKEQVITKSTAFPEFSLAQGVNVSGGDNAMSRGIYVQPYCDAAGNVYASDSVGYLVNISNAIRLVRSTALFTVAPPTVTSYTDISDAAMPELLEFFTNMFDEAHGVAIDSANIWLTSNLGTTWTRKTGAGLTISGRLLSPTYLFCVPADADIVFFTGKRSSGGSGVAMPCLTPDFGTTLVDISLNGLAGALDTVMSLAAGDMDDSTIIVDYYRA